MINKTELYDQLKLLKNDLHLLKIKKHELLSIPKLSKNLQGKLDQVNSEIDDINLRIEIIEIDLKKL